MKPANDPDVDYKAFVRQAYDRCAATYNQTRAGEACPEFGLLTSRVQEGACVLDVGCGGGIPVTRALAERFTVTGVDISAEQIRLARANVPHAQFVEADVMSVDFPPATFDAVIAFYVLFHLPREEHPELLQRIHGWLKPGGYLFATLSMDDEAPYTEEDFFGVPMYWSNYGLATYRRTLTEIGFSLLETTTIGHGFGDERESESHPLILARK